MTGHRSSEPPLKLEDPILFNGEWAFSELYEWVIGGRRAILQTQAGFHQARPGLRDNGANFKVKDENHCQPDSSIRNTANSSFAKV